MLPGWSIRSFNGIALVLLALYIAALPVSAEVTRLSFRPVDAGYSQLLDRAIFISSGPNQLHIYDVGGKADQVLPLPGVPLNLSLSSDGRYAAVAYADSISYVDLQTGTLLRTYTSLAVGTGKVILGNGYAYIFPLEHGVTIGVDLATGQSTTNAYESTSGGVFNPVTNAIYSDDDSSSPNGLRRYNLNGSSVSGGLQQSLDYRFPLCSPLTLSHDARKIYSGCGTVYSASNDPSKDMQYLGRFPIKGSAQSLTTSDALQQIALIVKSSNLPETPVSENIVHLIDSKSFMELGQITTTPFTAGTSTFAAHGRWAFYNRASTSLIIITQADPTAALTQDYAIENVGLTDPNSCHAQFGATMAAADAAGSYASTPILSGTNCVFTATSNAPWITLASGSYGSGDMSLVYLVRPNLSGSARSGTISLGTQVFTVVQDAPGAQSAMTPLSFRPVAADYDTALDKIVFVSTLPNELHLYDPSTRVDQIVPLPFLPLSVSVRPDGLFATVGHFGSISVVDLQALAVTSNLALDIDVGGILTASNGYAYAFSDSLSLGNMYSVELSTAALTPTRNTANGNVLRLDPTGQFLYSSGTPETAKWDISQGPARLLTSPGLPSLYSNFWLSKDGHQIVTSVAAVFLSSPSPSQDLAPAGRLSSATAVAWAANSQSAAETAVLTDISSTANTQLQIYSDRDLQLQGQIALPGFKNGTGSFVSHGRYLFWNAAESKLIAVTQADSSSGLPSDFAVYIVDAPSSIPACHFSVSPTSLTIPVGSAPYWFFDVESNCAWSPMLSGDNWIALSPGGLNTGNQRVFVTPFNNYGSARSASVQIGTATVTMKSAPSGCKYSLSTPSQQFSPDGGNSSVSLATGDTCPWSLLNRTSWLSISAASSGVGPATFQFSVKPNSNQIALSDSVNIAGLKFEVTVAASSAGLSSDFVPITPCRLADTRNAAGRFGGPYLLPNSIRTFPVSDSACNIPLSATAYALNVTVVPRENLDYLTVWSGNKIRPNVSTLNSRDGRVKANAVIIDSGKSRSISVFATGSTDLILDISGYFVIQGSSQALAFFPSAPCRVYDSRQSDGPLGDSEPAKTRELAVLQSNCNLPPEAKAYSLNFTSVPSTPSLGYLTAWPVGYDRPVVSTLNAPTGTVTANAAILQAGVRGDISTYVTDQSHLIVDTNGYFAPVQSGGLHFHSVDPCRVLDTRQTRTDYFQGTLMVQISGTCSIPPEASAVVVNTTVIPRQALGYLTLWPAGGSQPLTSTLNAYDGAVTSNMAIVKVEDGSINAFASDPAHLIVDVTGYFAP